LIRFLLDSHTSDANMLEHGTPRVTRKYKCYCYSICLKNIHIILKCFVESNRLTTQRALIILSQRLFWFSPPHQHELLNPLCANPCEETECSPRQWDPSLSFFVYVSAPATPLIALVPCGPSTQQLSCIDGIGRGHAFLLQKQHAFSLCKKNPI